MKRIYAIILLIFLVCSILIIPTSVEANANKFSIEYMQSASNNFLNAGTETGFDVSSTISGIANILVTLGVVIVIAGFLIVGIKYMVATPQEAAKLKSKLIGLTIAGIVILGSYGIWMFTGDLLNNIAQPKETTNSSTTAVWKR